MSEGVVIAGPASPMALADRLSGSDREQGRELRGLGGSAVNHLVRAILDEGESVELVTLTPELDEYVELTGPRLRILIGPYRKRARTRALDLFKDEREAVSLMIGQTNGAVVHAQWTYEFALGALASPARPALVTARDAPLTILRLNRDWYRLVRTLLAGWVRLRRPVLTANSPYLARQWRREMRFRGEVPVIPNIVHSPSPSHRDELNGGRTVLDVSSEGRLKNVAALVRALPRVLESWPDARLRLVGPGLTENSEVARLAVGLGVARAVDCLGPLYDAGLEREFAGAHVFAHASLEESFGMSVAEAMARSLPTVGGADAGAVPWLLDHGRAGLLVDMRDSDRVAETISRLLSDSALRSRLASAAAERAHTVFAPRAVAAIALELYERVRRSGP